MSLSRSSPQLASSAIAMIAAVGAVLGLTTAALAGPGLSTLEVAAARVLLETKLGASLARGELERVARAAARDITLLRQARRASSLAAPALSQDERLLVRELAERRLRTVPGLDERAPSPARAGFLEGTGAAEAQARGVRRVTKFFGELNSCLRSMPPNEARHTSRGYLLEGLGITVAATLFGHVVAAGEEEIEWDRLPVDLLVAAASSAFGGRLTPVNLKYSVKWIRLALFNEARAAVDAAIYVVSPASGSGAELVESVEDRAFFNAAWGAASPALAVSLQTLLVGLSCKYPEWKAALKTARLPIRLATAFGTSTLYFELRRRSIDQ